MTRLFLSVALICAAGFAFAHDSPDNWIGQERRTNSAGQLCCGKGDCFPFEASKINTTPAGYVFPDGQVIPFGKAAPSIDKQFWRCRWGGETKCVFAPLGSS